MNVDIILITYNQEQYIRQAVEGILMQRVATDVSVRIIVADDCSTDRTLAKLHDCLDGDIKLVFGQKPDVIYLSQTHNLGHIRNYQRAFAACSGDYVAIIEGDDFWSSPLHLQTHVDFLDLHRECVLTTQRPTWYYENEQRFEPTAIFHFSDGDFRYVTIEDEIRVNQIVNLSSCVIRGEAIHQLDTQIFECSVLDWPMYVNLSQMGLLCILTGTTSVYRAKSSGLYAGLDKEAELKMDEQLLSEIEHIFPQYADSYSKARLLMHPKPKSTRRKITECILWPFAKIGKYCSYVHNIYNELKR